MLRRLNTESRDEIRLSELTKVLFIGNYLPRKCGIATFTFDLHTALATTFPKLKTGVIAINDTPEGYNYDKSVKFEIQEQDPVDYLRATDYIHQTGANLVCLQHEYGIYGGSCGSMIIPLLRSLRIPIVTTFHTILQEATPEQRNVLSTIIHLSSRVVTMAEIGRKMLMDLYNAEEKRVDMILHGIPEMEFPDTEAYKKEMGLSGRKIILTFGLLGPNKGIEYAIKALPEIVRRVPNVLYVILGQTHPALVRERGEAYRNSLEWMAKNLNVSGHVKFINNFVDMSLLKKYIASCDIYLTPYLHEQQITSGTLSYAFGMGSAVVSTPYWHATELLRDGRGHLVPFRESVQMADACAELLENDQMRINMKTNAFEYGRTMTWSNTARKYMRVFEEARDDMISEPVVIPMQTSLPALKLDHIIRLTDTTGIMHSSFMEIPNLASGYYIDDNARALMLCASLKFCQHVSYGELRKMETRFAALIQYAFQPDALIFRGAMNYDRTWKDLVGSKDCNARVMRALAMCCKAKILELWSCNLFLDVMRFFDDCKSLKTIANLLLSISDFLESYPSEKDIPKDLNKPPKFYQAVLDARKTFSDFLVECLEKTKTEEWTWFENTVTYENALLPHALIVTGRDMHNEKMQNYGLDSLDWLMDQQMNNDGVFCPIGNEKWMCIDGTKSMFNQHPPEVACTVDACLSAAALTKEELWVQLAYAAFNWFLGGNVHGKSLYSSETGGVRDALTISGMNNNKGAESVLVYLQSLLLLQHAGVTEDISIAHD